MKPVGEPGQTMQRVKVGLTGLAAVLLLIVLATAVFRSVDRQRLALANGAGAELEANMSAANASDPSNEPLAEIGVAPAGQNDSASAGAGRRH